jgi:hypothetical protein
VKTPVIVAETVEGPTVARRAGRRMEGSMATQSSTQKETRGAEDSKRQDRGNAGSQPAMPPEPGVEMRDELYGIISVLYHALQGAETYAQYEDDAEEAGDDELVAFFQDCQDEELARADRAKTLLMSRMQSNGQRGVSFAIDEEDE